MRSSVAAPGANVTLTVGSTAVSATTASPSASKLLQVLDGERFGDDALVAWAILAFGCWVAVYNVASVAVARLQ